MTGKRVSEQEETRWLLLIPQLPAKPPYLRVKIWRRLQALGAISVKNAVYVLPDDTQTREDFQWVLREIERGGGDGMICEASLVDGLRDAEVRALFNKARDADYTELTAELRALAPKHGKSAKASDDRRPQLVKMRQRFDQIAALDFFNATGRLTVEALFSEIEQSLNPSHTLVEPKKKQPTPDLKGKTWVTRRDIHVDRIACAWLIRRFIDPRAKFKFVSEKNYKPAKSELRFDMFKGEFTHVGDKCSIEVLLERSGLNDPALQRIAEIVHDIDLKDHKFGREETAGIAHVISGICVTQERDEDRIIRASAVLDDTYEIFRKRGRR